MTIKINDDLITLEIDGMVTAKAVPQPGGWWEVTGWPRFLDRNQAISALTVTEMLASGCRADAPTVIALCGELR